MTGLQYDWPQGAALILIAPLIAYAFFHLFRYRQTQLNRLAAPQLQISLVIKRSSDLYWIRTGLFCLVWIFAVLSLMQPKGNGRYVATQIQRQENHEQVIFLIDASASMGIADMNNGHTRLHVAKEIADASIAHSSGVQIAVYAFTNATLQIVPLTIDSFFTRMSVNKIALNEGGTSGTDFKQLLESIQKEYIEHASSKVHKTIILLSDGEDTIREGLTGDAARQYGQEIDSLLKEFTIPSVKFIAVALGSKKGKTVPGVMFQGAPVTSAVNTEWLKKIAGPGGLFFDANETGALQIAKEIDSEIKKNSQTTADQKTEETNQLYFDEYYQTPLAAAIISLILVLILPATKKWKGQMMCLAGALIFFPSFMQAAKTLDSEQVLINRALVSYDADDYQTAIQQLQEIVNSSNEDWKIAILQYDIGTALLKLKKPDEALTHFATSESYDSQLPVLNFRLGVNKVIATSMLPVDIYRLKTLFDELQEVQKSACELQIAEGKKECSDLSAVNGLSAQINALLQAWLKEHGQSGLMEKGAKATLDEVYNDLLALYQLGLIDILKNPPSFNQQIEKVQALYRQKIQENPSLSLADKYLQNAKEAFQNNHLTRSRVFLEAASGAVEETKRQYDLLPATILRSGIARQELNLRITKLLTMLDPKEADISAPDVRLSDIQESAIKATHDFYTQVIEEQKKMSLNEDTASMWEQVLILFSNGKASAQQSLKQLQTSPLRFSTVLTSQRKTINLWKEALAILERIEAQTKITENQEQNKNVNKTLEQLQEMESEDQSHSIINLNPTENQVLRPW